MNLHLTLFQDLISLCKDLSPEQYTFKCKQLNQVAVGEHLRHSVEFYSCLKAGIALGKVNYDARLRDKHIQNDPLYAIAIMEDLSSFFSALDQTDTLILSSEESPLSAISTSIARELLYCLDHAIHHQALIKIGLREMGLEHLVSPAFGVAYSTLRYRAKN